MGERPDKQFRPPLQAPAALRLGLPHLMQDTPKRQVRPDPRHAVYVTIRELKLA
ncbi:hypothetical protein [Maricaulis sp.]|uniref:hypothetical protein n=1 Tax=Maricaulis sp. TaxID=1486257 RepID=UPI002B272BB0|nr:hypothetical protein [Maricaulis sp.]